MNQQSQSRLLLGIGAITAVVVAGYFGLDYLGGKKSLAAGAAVPTDFSSTINAATESVTGSGDPSAGLSAAEAKRIGEQVAREVATQVAQAIVDQRVGSNANGGGGLSEADARRIGEEEGRRVAQEVASATVQQAMAAGGGGSSGAGLTAQQAEQIGMAAGQRAARQVAAATARDVVRSEFGGKMIAQSPAGPSAADVTVTAPAGDTSPSMAAATTVASSGGGGVDALRAWWTTPASGDFGLLYAGQPKGEPAIALLFSEQPSDSALSQNVKVYDARGSRVSGNWEGRDQSSPRGAARPSTRPLHRGRRAGPGQCNRQGRQSRSARSRLRDLKADTASRITGASRFFCGATGSPNAAVTASVATAFA